MLAEIYLLKLEAAEKCRTQACSSTCAVKRSHPTLLATKGFFGKCRSGCGDQPSIRGIRRKNANDVPQNTHDVLDSDIVSAALNKPTGKTGAPY